MIVSLVEDFTSGIVLDSELLAMPDSGLYLNSGTHPSITLENMLAFLPSKDIICDPWKTGSTYALYETTRNKADLVIYNGKIYQSIASANIGNTPDAAPTKWLPTNKESLSLKSLIYKVTDKVRADLGLTKRLINAQKIYEVGDQTLTLPNDYAAFVFEFKGSDYVTMTINKVFLQKDSSTPVNLYVINQGDLVATLDITPADGDVEWEVEDYSFTGSGKWIFAIDSTDVIVGNGYIDPLIYDGFIVYTASGLGASPEGSVYSETVNGVGLGFDVSVHKDGGAYLVDNLGELGNFFISAFEYIVFQTFLHNPNNKSNRAERIQMEKELLIAELKSLEGDTVVSRYKEELKSARKVIDKTYDNQLGTDNDELIVEHEIS